MHYSMLVIDDEQELKSCFDCEKGTQLKCEVSGIKLFDPKCVHNNYDDVLNKISHMCYEYTDNNEWEEYASEEEVKEEFDELPEDKKSKYKDHIEYGEEKHAPYDADMEGFGYNQNPSAIYDWCEVGGRWRGLLKAKDGRKYNSLYAKDLDKECAKKMTTYGVYYVSSGEYITKETLEISKQETKEYLPKELLKDELQEYIFNDLIKSKMYTYDEETNKLLLNTDKEITITFPLDELIWDKIFYDKFLKDLKPTQQITVVDYHS